MSTLRKTVNQASKHFRMRGNLSWHTTKPSRGARKVWARHIDKLARDARRKNR